MLKILLSLCTKIIISYKITLLSYLRLSRYFIRFFAKLLQQLFIIKVYKKINIYITGNTYIKKIFLIIKILLKILTHLRFFIVTNIISCYIQLLFYILFYNVYNKPIIYVFMIYLPSCYPNVLHIIILVILMILILISELQLYKNKLFSPGLSILGTIISYSTLRKMINETIFLQNTLFTINDIY